MPLVHFFQEQTRFKLPHPRKSSRWILNVLKLEKSQSAGINFIFCTDRYLRAMNVEYLNHDTFTDVITFDYGNGGAIEGDIFISIDRVKENAMKLEIDLDEEVHRVMVHGVLHLLGYSDKSKTAKSRMRKKEDAYLSLRR